MREGEKKEDEYLTIIGILSVEVTMYGDAS